MKMLIISFMIMQTKAKLGTNFKLWSAAGTRPPDGGRQARAERRNCISFPAAIRHSKKELFEYGNCDESARPGTGSKLYYINSCAMCWPSDHAKKPLTGQGLSLHQFAPCLHKN
jgi:hypothetical protein